MPRQAPHIRQSVCIKVLAHVFSVLRSAAPPRAMPIGASVFPPVHCCLDTYRVGCGEASWGPPHIPVGGATSLLHSYNEYATRGVVELRAGAKNTALRERLAVLAEYSIGAVQMPTACSLATP